jgi:hypothetical protein
VRGAAGDLQRDIERVTVVLQKIVGHDAPLPDSYFGPPESRPVGETR